MSRLDTLRKRLAKAKADAAANKYAMIRQPNDVPLCAPSDDWRAHALSTAPHRRKGSGNWQRVEDMEPRASAYSRAYYADSWDDTGLRLVGSAYDVCRPEHSRRVDHTGWYTDGFESGTLAGYVLQLPARDGKPCYVPGTAHSDWDGVTLYPLDTFDDKHECAAAADQYAEHAAEKERDYQEAYQAGQRASDLETEANDYRADIILTISDMRTARRALSEAGIGSIAAIERLCQTARNKVESLLDDMREARARRDKIISEYAWRHNGFRENHMRAPFCEAYGKDI